MLRNGVLVFGSLIVSLLLAEVCIRALTHIEPLGLNFPLGISSRISIPLTERPAIGPMLETNATGISEHTCFRTPISTNEFGFHDVPWPTDVRGGVAIIGDSFVRATEVPISSTVAGIVRERLGVPVVSAGNNEVGTLGEIELYREYVKKLHPKVVVLLFFLGNDVKDNNCAFNGATMCARITAGVLSENENSTRVARSPFTTFMDEHCSLCRLTAYGFKNFDILAARTFPNSVTRHLGTRLDESWKITERALSDFQREVEEEGSTFIVAIVPGRNLFKETDDEQKLLVLATRHDMTTLNLRPQFEKYATRFNLPYPFLSFRCDGHWNPLGHYVVAEHIITHLRETHALPLVPALSKPEPPLLSPALFLGAEPFKEIYGGGIYAPPSPY